MPVHCFLRKEFFMNDSSLETPDGRNGLSELQEIGRRLEKNMERNRRLIIIDLMFSILLAAVLVISSCSMGLEDLFDDGGQYSDKDLEGLTFESTDACLGFVSLAFGKDGTVFVSEGGRAPAVKAAYSEGKMTYKGVEYTLDLWLFYDYMEVFAPDGTSAVFHL